jgi:hypothetical protein
MRYGAVFLALVMLSINADTAAAQHCRLGDIEVERTTQGVRCRSPTAAECLHRVGTEFPDKRKRLCSLTIGKCFNEKKAQVTTATFGCLASCLDPKELLMMRIDVPRCARSCGTAELMVASDIADKCLLDAVNDCQGDALAQQRSDENNCRR